MAKRSLEILEALDFGQDVAENENDLERFFIETTDFKTLVSGNVDVIRGHKGMGKSAIYRILVSDQYDVPQLSKTCVLPASNATGSPIFQQFIAGEQTEDELRLLWTAYLASVIGNHACDVHPSSSTARAAQKQIAEVLTAMRLRTGKGRKPSLLNRLRTARAFSVGLGTSLDGIPSLSFQVELDQASSTITASEQEFLELIELATTIYEDVDTRCWILLDRLDEAFAKNSERELFALRALLRSHMAICALLGGQQIVRPKIFIRTDIYDRITRFGGFTNVTHLRDLNLVWTARSIVLLVVQRAISGATVRKALLERGVNLGDPLAVWQEIFPRIIQGDNSQVWIAKSTCDGTGAFNPRNVLTLLALAQKRSLVLRRTNPRAGDSGEIILTDALISAFGELSRKRLDDTILAEFPDVRKSVDILRGGKASFETRDELRQVLLMAEPDADGDILIERLLYIGVLKQISADIFSIARLYRPALKTGNAARRADS